MKVNKEVLAEKLAILTKFIKSVEERYDAERILSTSYRKTGNVLFALIRVRPFSIFFELCLLG